MGLFGSNTFILKCREQCVFICSSISIKYFSNCSASHFLIIVVHYDENENEHQHYRKVCSGVFLMFLVWNLLLKPLFNPVKSWSLCFSGIWHNSIQIRTIIFSWSFYELVPMYLCKSWWCSVSSYFGAKLVACILLLWFGSLHIILAQRTVIFLWWGRIVMGPLFDKLQTKPVVCVGSYF